MTRTNASVYITYRLPGSRVVYRRLTSGTVDGVRALADAAGFHVVTLREATETDRAPYVYDITDEEL